MASYKPQLHTTSQPHITSQNEHILVVARRHLFTATHPVWHGISTTAISYILEAIAAHQEFLPRSLMEEDPTYKQIIPYLIFKYHEQYFLMQRSSTASEKRLQDKFSLGIGGHIRQKDMQGATQVIDWARREFHEEIHYTGSFSCRWLGVINSEVTPVDQVHLGLILLLEGDSDQISIKSELKSGRLVSLDELERYRMQLEGWSSTALDTIKDLTDEL